MIIMIIIIIIIIIIIMMIIIIIIIIIRERRPGCDIAIILVVIGALGGGMKEVLRDVERVFSERLERKKLAEKAVAEMQKTVLMDSESMVRKVLSGLVQHED